MKKRILCVIPAKGRSTRVPRKNIRLLNGKPLIYYTINAALRSKVFDNIYVSTEDKKIAEISQKYGVDVINRPVELSEDLSPVVNVCVHAITYLEELGHKYDILCVLLTTTPLRTKDDIINAYNLFINQDGSSFLMGVTDYLFDPFLALKDVDGHLEPVFPEYVNKRRQELPKVYVDNGAIYIVRIKEFLNKRTFYGPNLMKYYMPFNRSIDIDTETEFKLAELFLEVQ